MTSPRPPHHAFPWLRVVTVLLVMSVGIAAIWAIIKQVDDSDIDHDVPTPTATAPVDPPATATPVAPSTPETETPAWPAGSLPAMLELAPDRLADDSLPLNDIARYVDIAGWMKACGVPTPVSLDDPALASWEAELDNLALPTSLRERGLDAVWRATYGFDLTQVQQVLIVGQAPDYVMIINGTFDEAELQAAWVSSGYQAVEIEGQTVWSLYPEDAIDLSAPASRPAMGTLNNVTLLEDGTLVAAARSSRIGSVLRVANGDAPSLAENDDIAPLLTPETGVDQLVSAVLSKGSLFQGTGSTMPEPNATPVAASPVPLATPESDQVMPVPAVGLVGIPLTNAGSQSTPIPGSAHYSALSIMLVYEDVDDAAVAETEITARLETSTSPVTGEPYVERIAKPIIGTIDSQGRGVVLIQAELHHGLGDWLAILSNRDLGFIFWLPEE